MARRRPNLIARFLISCAKWGLVYVVAVMVLWNIDITVSYKTSLPPAQAFSPFKLAKGAVQAVQSVVRYVR